ncbi:glycoside hydrolase family 18 protein [Suillus clintonianus]|uniref:glycoside hydrolase family 18 protein n=1 Tax=Suillus clintonianus TaxID=1904413 RepID=UPI001B8778DD|nr:glycoside hydrolase family 18 protein [Suillus clintonianus]KAG2136048.1 glycoside hydrolase family 18 protein [Suillus clintonianus]
MVSFMLLSIVTVLVAIGGVWSMPLMPLMNATISARATPAAPHFVIYSDKWVPGETGPPPVSSITGYNVFALSFWLVSGPADQAEEWTLLDETTRASIKTSYNNAGISLIVSAFGSTDVPTTEGCDPTTIANKLADYVLEYDLDGVDVDYEDLYAMDAENGSAEIWLVAFTIALRERLPQGQYILTHAPVAPWFSTRYASGAYLMVHENVGLLIDWYNVQFYNQGTSEYTTCDGLITTSSSMWPNTALFQIAAGGIPLDKLVIGKPATSIDASNGYMSTSLLAQCLDTAVQQGWYAGVMVCQFPDAIATWITAVRSLAFP